MLLTREYFIPNSSPLNSASAANQHLLSSCNLCNSALNASGNTRKQKIQLLSSRSIFTLEKQDVKYMTDFFKVHISYPAERDFLPSNHLRDFTFTPTSLHYRKHFGGCSARIDFRACNISFHCFISGISSSLVDDFCL